MGYINGKEILFSSNVNITGGDTAHLEAEIEEHEKRISNIEHQLAPEYVTTDESTAYEKTVPAKACPYAQINKVGGGENLITAEAIGVEGSEVLPFTYEDNILTFSGTLTENGYIDIGSIPDLPIGTTLIMNVPEGFEAFVECNAEYEDEEENYYGGDFRFYFENGEATLYDDDAKAMVEAGYTGGFSIGYIELVPTEDITDASFELACYIERKEVDALEIPEAVQELEGYGKGGYIDFERKVFVYGETETNISEHLTEGFIEVVGGGTITAVNEGNVAVYSSITYMLKEG